MPDRFDELIRKVLRDGTEHAHEAMPADFGPPEGRLEMFIRCLEVVANRYNDVRIRISGERAALMEMGLVPDGDILVGKRLFKAYIAAPGPRPDVIRLTFSPLV